MTYSPEAHGAPSAAPNDFRPLRPRPVAWAAMLLLAGASAQAQDNTPPLQVAQAATALPAVTVTATLTEQDARTAPASVTVIDRD